MPVILYWNVSSLFGWPELAILSRLWNLNEGTRFREFLSHDLVSLFLSDFMLFLPHYLGLHCGNMNWRLKTWRGEKRGRIFTLEVIMMLWTRMASIIPNFLARLHCLLGIKRTWTRSAILKNYLLDLLCFELNINLLYAFGLGFWLHWIDLFSMSYSFALRSEYCSHIFNLIQNYAVRIKAKLFSDEFIFTKLTAQHQWKLCPLYGTGFRDKVSQGNSHKLEIL